VRQACNAAWWATPYSQFATSPLLLMDAAFANEDLRLQIAGVRGAPAPDQGQSERQFFYGETNLLNARTFDALEHLNEVTRAWLAEVADVRILRDFKESPRERHAREQPHLSPLPADVPLRDSTARRVQKLAFFLVKAEGLEPSTYGLKVRCSTD
jgi:hypothetical protein